MHTQLSTTDLTYASVDEALLDARRRLEAVCARKLDDVARAELVVLRHLLEAIREEILRESTQNDPLQYILGQSALPVLTPRESEVLTWMAHGLRNKEIAEQLTITERTVGFHVGNILAKLGADGRVEAIRSALALGLLRLGGESEQARLAPVDD